MNQPAYFTTFKNSELTRTPSGVLADTTIFTDFPHLTFGILPRPAALIAALPMTSAGEREQAMNGPAENEYDVIGTGPIGQTVADRARAAGLKRRCGRAGVGRGRVLLEQGSTMTYRTWAAR